MKRIELKLNQQEGSLGGGADWRPFREQGVFTFRAAAERGMLLWTGVVVRAANGAFARHGPES